MHKNKAKSYKIFLIALTFSLLSAAPVFALETNIPGLSGTSSLPDFVAFIFNWAMGLAEGIAALAFLIGAVGFIISGDNAELNSDSKNRMKSAILGLILLVSSHLIMRTINPQLVTPGMEALDDINLPGVEIATIPGVFFFSDEGCDPKKEYIGPLSVSLNPAPDPFYVNIKSVKIVNAPEKDEYFGVILHENSLDKAGKCSEPITTNGCQSVSGITVRAADVFVLKKNNPGSAGTGVDFFSEPYGDSRGSKGGYFMQPGKTITSPFTELRTDQMTFIYKGIAQDQAYINRNKTFKDHPGSIDINGMYIVALYSSNSYCQTFNSKTGSLRVENMNAQPMSTPASGAVDLYRVLIIPTINK